MPKHGKAQTNEKRKMRMNTRASRSASERAPRLLDSVLGSSPAASNSVDVSLSLSFRFSRPAFTHAHQRLTSLWRIPVKTIFFRGPRRPSTQFAQLGRLARFFEKKRKTTLNGCDNETCASHRSDREQSGHVSTSGCQ